VTLQAPPNLLGNYHLANCPGSPACNLGASLKAAPSYQQPPASVNAPALDFDDQPRPALGGFDAGADEFTTATPPPPPPAVGPLDFSTLGNTNPPGVAGTADDADIYSWNGTAFSRSIDASAAPYNLPGGANVDGFDRVSATQFYLSFTGQVNVPGIGNVQDEDVVFFNGTSWSLFFDGSVRGLTGAAATDLDAISIVGGQLYFSTDNGAIPPGAGGVGDDADIYRWNGASTYTRVIDASGTGSLGLPNSANVDGFVRVDATHFYLSFNADTTVPVLGAVQDEDVIFYNAGVWSVYFDSTALGLGTTGSLDVDAFDVP
jgi:hypothetical protein